MSQKNVILKFISIFLAFSLLISFNSTGLIAFADNTSINTIEDEALKEAKEDEKSWPRAGKWELARQRGLVPPSNYFHNKVQNEIRDRHPEFQKNELTVTKLNGKTGRVDVWNYDYDSQTAYFWEVKPGSYISLFKMIKAKNQLNEYVLSIWSTVKGKTETQARRIVINFDDSNKTLTELIKQFHTWDISTLDELFVVKDSEIIRVILK